MLFVHASREDLLDCLPKGIVMAEVGVAEGDFAAAILARVAPSALHLIDPWLRQDRADYAADPNNAAPDEQERRHGAVVARFRDAPAVRVHRAFSTDQAARFGDGSLDAVYIDAMHTHDAVIADLGAFAPKLKPDGLLFGHDFVSHPNARQMNFGVVGGVVEFAKRSGFEIVALTSESFATYAMARRGAGGGTRGAFVQRLLASSRFMVELPVELAGAFQHKRVGPPGRPMVRHLPSFRM
jgi:hypothetical protein